MDTCAACLHWQLRAPCAACAATSPPACAACAAAASVAPLCAGCAASAAAPHVVVWDFDCSLIEENSDTHIPALFSPDFTALINAERSPGSWTALMARIFVAMHAAGVAAPAIEAAAAALPVAADALGAVADASADGAPQYIVSDANSVFIDRFVAAHGLADTFRGRVVTNPAAFDAAGCLRLAPYTPAAAPHGCARCPANLCKSRALAALGLAREGGVAYVGDGGGDECAARALGRGCVVLARACFPLAKRLAAAPPAARVVEWGSYAELRAALRVARG